MRPSLCWVELEVMLTKDMLAKRSNNNYRIQISSQRDNLTMLQFSVNKLKLI